VYLLVHKEEEVAPEEQAPIDALAFDAENPPIKLPAALQNSTTAEAVMINSFAASANVITSY
jgi:hypothetical protein